MRDETGIDILWYEGVIDLTCILNADATNAGDFPPLVGQYITAGPPVGGPRVVRNVKPVIEGQNNLRRRTDLTDQEFKDIAEAQAILAAGFRTDLTADELAAFGAGGFKGGNAGFKKPKPDAPLKLNAAKPGPGGGIAVGLTGRRALVTTRPTVPFTDAELRERLRRPRRQLLVWMHSGENAQREYLLCCPHPGCETDARHGPLCEVLATTEIHGAVTGVYKLRFRYWEAPALVYGVATEPGATSLGTRPGGGAKLSGAGRKAAPSNKVRAGWNIDARKVQRPQESRRVVLQTPALVSNRWSMRFEADPETYLMNQVIEGQATFRADVLAARGITADQIRKQIFHPIPTGYVRQPPAVDCDSLGTSVKYAITDKQVLMNAPGAAKHRVVRVEVEQTVDYSGYDMPGGGI